MRHIQSSFGDGWLKTAFCVYCGCEDTVKLLKDDCPGEFREQSVIAEKEHKIIKEYNRK